MYSSGDAGHHHVPAARLTRRYFQRWWFGKGISRAALERVQPVTELGLDLRETPHLLDVPRFMYGSALRDMAGVARERLRGRPTFFRHRMMISYFMGYFWARWRARRAEPPSAQRAPIDGASNQRNSKVVNTGR